MYFLHAINSGRQTRLLNVLGQIAMILGDRKNLYCTARGLVLVNVNQEGCMRSMQWHIGILGNSLSVSLKTNRQQKNRYGHEARRRADHSSRGVLPTVVRRCV